MEKWHWFLGIDLNEVPGFWFHYKLNNVRCTWNHKKRRIRKKWFKRLYG